MTNTQGNAPKIFEKLLFYYLDSKQDD